MDNKEQLKALAARTAKGLSDGTITPENGKMILAKIKEGLAATPTPRPVPNIPYTDTYHEKPPKEFPAFNVRFYQEGERRKEVMERPTMAGSTTAAIREAAGKGPESIQMLRDRLAVPMPPRPVSAPRTVSGVSPEPYQRKPEEISSGKPLQLTEREMLMKVLGATIGETQGEVMANAALIAAFSPVARYAGKTMGALTRAVPKPIGRALPQEVVGTRSILTKTGLPGYKKTIVEETSKLQAKWPGSEQVAEDVTKAQKNIDKVQNRALAVAQKRILDEETRIMKGEVKAATPITTFMEQEKARLIPKKEVTTPIYKGGTNEIADKKIADSLVKEVNKITQNEIGGLTLEEKMTIAAKEIPVDKITWLEKVEKIFFQSKAGWRRSRSVIGDLLPTIEKKYTQVMDTAGAKAGSTTSLTDKLFDSMTPEQQKLFRLAADKGTLTEDRQVNFALTVVNGFNENLRVSLTKGGNYVRTLEGKLEAISPPKTQAWFPHYFEKEMILAEKGKTSSLELAIENLRARESSIDMATAKNMLTQKGIPYSEEAIKKIRLSKTPLTYEQAYQRLTSTLENPQIPVLGELKPRIKDKPGYAEDLKNVYHKFYYNEIFRDEFSKTFGANGEQAWQVINSIADPTKRQMAKAAWEVTTKMTPRGEAAEMFHKWEMGATSFVSRQYMVLSALNNMYQGVKNAWYRTNTISVIRGFRDAVSKGGTEFAKEAGAIQGQLTSAMEEYQKTIKFFERNGFMWSEQNNRIQTTLVAKNYLPQLLSALKKNPKDASVLRDMASLGLNSGEVLKRGYFTRPELLKTANRMTRELQFRFSPSEFPILANLSYGKLIFHLQGYNIGQVNFFKDFVLAEAKKGNYFPLSKMMATGFAFGEAQAGLWSLITGRERPEGWRRVIDDYAYDNSLGLLSEILFPTTYGESILDRVLTKPPAMAYASEVLKAPGEPGKFLARRVVPQAVVRNIPWKIKGVPLGLPAAMATRAISERLIKKEPVSEKKPIPKWKD